MSAKPRGLGRGLDDLPARGFAGQIAFFSGESSTPVEAEGDVEILLFDDQGGRQVREVRAGSGYLSQSGPRLVFGLADGARPQRLEVRWPDGTTRTVAADAVPTAGGEVLRLEPES